MKSINQMIQSSLNYIRFMLMGDFFLCVFGWWFDFLEWMNKPKRRKE